MRATILKGIVGGFEFSFFQRNLKEFTRKAMEMCLRVLKESNKSRSDSYSCQVTVLIISHITFRDCHVHIFCDNLSRNSCMFWWSKGCQSLWPVIAVLSSLRCDFSLGAPATSSWRSPHQPLVAYYWPFDKLQYSGTPIQERRQHKKIIISFSPRHYMFINSHKGITSIFNWLWDLKISTLFAVSHSLSAKVSPK